MGIQRSLDDMMTVHGNRQDLSYGWLATTWASYQSGPHRQDQELEFSQQSPSEIKFSDCNIPLVSAYFAFARILQNPIADSGKIIFQPTEPLPEIASIASNDYFAAQSWTNISYPTGLTGKNICIHCRLQSWTYKPAAS